MQNKIKILQHEVMGVVPVEIPFSEKIDEFMIEGVQYITYRTPHGYFAGNDGFAIQVKLDVMGTRGTENMTTSEFIRHRIFKRMRHFKNLLDKCKDFHSSVSEKQLSKNKHNAMFQNKQFEIS